MTRVGFESTIPVFERAKTVHASDSAATVIGSFVNTTLVYSAKSSFPAWIGTEWRDYYTLSLLPDVHNEKISCGYYVLMLATMT
jgi:hypothetical protein